MRLSKRWLSAAAGVLLAATPLAASAAEEADNAGRVIMVRGKTTVLPPGVVDGPAEPLARGQWLPEGATVRTGSNGAARVLMRDRSILMLGANSRLQFAQYRVQPQKRSVRLKVLVGRLWARVTTYMGAKPQDYTVEAPSAVAGIRGTDLVVQVDDSGATTITCVTGSVQVGDVGGGDPVMLGPRESGQADGSGGGVVVITLSAEQIRNLVAASTTRSGLDRRQAEDRLQRLDDASGGGGDGDASSGGGDGDDGETPGEQTPDADVPLDLEPGIGETTRVRGRIEVRQR